MLASQPPHPPNAWERVPSPHSHSPFAATNLPAPKLSGQLGLELLLASFLAETLDKDIDIDFLIIIVTKAAHSGNALGVWNEVQLQG